MRIWTSLARWIIATALLLGILITLLVTPFGLRAGVFFNNHFLSSKISYRKLSGSILGTIDIHELHYQDDTNTLDIHHLTLDWRPWHLLTKTIYVTKLNADTIKLVMKEPEEPSSFSLPNLRIKLRELSIDQLSIQQPSDPKTITLEQIRLTSTIEPNRIHAQLQANLKQPFPLRLLMTANGNFDAYKLYTRLTGDNFSWHLYGSGSRNQLALHLKNGKTLGGTLSFNSNFSWEKYWQWNAEVLANQINLSNLNKKWPQTLTLNLKTEGNLAPSKPNFQVDAALTAPGTNIQINAAQKNTLNLRWKIAIDNLASLYQGAKGTLHTEGSFIPDHTNPTFTGSIKANQFYLLGYRAKSFSADWLLHLDQSKKLSYLSISGDRINAAGLRFKTIDLQGKGTQARHTLQGNLIPVGSRINFRIQGSLDKTQWRGQLDELTMRTKRYRDWTLAQPTTLSFSQNAATLQKFCLKVSGGKDYFCIKGDWNASKPWSFSANAFHFNLGMLTAPIWPQLHILTTADMRGEIKGNGTQLTQGNLQLNLNPGNLEYRIGGGLASSTIQEGKVQLQITPKNTDMNANFTLSKNNNITSKLSIDHKSTQINGFIRADLNDLSAIDKALKEIESVKGSLQTRLTISGKSKNPDIRGSINLNNGSIYFPQLGITANKITTKISSFSNNTMQYEITAYSKDQPVHVNGKLIATPDGFINHTTLRGTNVLIMDNPEYQIYASPDLKITINNDEIDLSGRVDIPKAEIKPAEFSNASSLPSDQIVYTAGAPMSEDSYWKVITNITVNLGDAVHINTSGFDAMIHGNVKIIGKPKVTTLGNGQIFISKGSYSAYGKTLIIAPDSFIQFINSPIDNPLFNVRATKTIKASSNIRSQSFGENNIIVGVELRGSFRQPKISFFSIPANLSQADILSYLVLGYASTSSSGTNAGLLLQAANSLGGKGAGVGGALSEIKQGLGIEELGVESETLMSAVGTPLEQQNSFVIGKRLTQNIYIRYSIGLGQGPLTPVNIFQLRYTFNPHWAIQTDSSSLGNGGDILYTIETN